MRQGYSGPLVPPRRRADGNNGPVLNPETQYATDSNLRARQRLWEYRTDDFDLFAWVLGLAGAVGTGTTVLDVGCGNGLYLERLRRAGATAVGCDLSAGMLDAARDHPLLVNGDAQALPFRSASVDVVLAPHMLYHVPDRGAAVLEIRRALRPGGRCVAVTNGAGHMASLRSLVEASARKSNPGWEMANPATRAFSLENGGAQLAAGFDLVELVRPPSQARVEITDPRVVTDYVTSTGDHYQPHLLRPWAEIVAEVTEEVAAVIAIAGAFRVDGDTGAFVCS